MWKSATWVVLDVETTGLEVESGDRVIEVGVTLVENKVIKGSWSQLLNPGISELKPIITETTGITINDLRGKPQFGSIASKIAELIDKSFGVVAYNAPFDEPFFRHELAQEGITIPNKTWLDPLIWCRKYNGPYNNKLIQSCKRYDIESSNAHRASGDTDMTAKLFLKLIPRLPDSFDAMVSVQAIWQRKQESEFRARRRRKSSR